MFSKVTTAFLLFAAATRLAVAIPPACLIAAVNTQSNPSDISAICGGSNITQVEQFICQKCADNIDTAFSAFSSICGNAGVTISDPSCASNSTSTSSSGPSGTASASSGSGTGSGSGTATATRTHSGSSSGTPTSSSSSSSQSTGAASRLGMDIVGMAALGLFGAALAM